MKPFVNPSAQGDLLLRRVKKLPKDVIEQSPVEERHVVAHSETGHDHYLASRGVRYFHTSDPLVAFLEVQEDGAILRHARDFDTHEPIKIDKGTYELRRQREWTPEGLRRVED